jgi:hypothetical protein
MQIGFSFSYSPLTNPVSQSSPAPFLSASVPLSIVIPGAKLFLFPGRLKTICSLTSLRKVKVYMLENMENMENVHMQSS